MVINPVVAVKPSENRPRHLETSGTGESDGLSITTTAAECGAQLAVLMCEVQDGLGQVGGLDDTSDLDRALFFDELAHHEQEFGRELYNDEHCN